MNVYEDFIPKQYQLELYNRINSTSFRWNYQDGTIDPKHGPDCYDEPPYRDTPYFQHIAYRENVVSENYELFKPMLYFFEYKTGYEIRNVIRIVNNLVMPTEKNWPGLPHVDSSYNEKINLKTMLYYVNNIDGDTLLFAEKFSGKKPTSLTLVNSSSPKMGKAIVFDSNRFHCSSTPTKHRRMVINFILEVK